MQRRGCIGACVGVAMCVVLATGGVIHAQEASDRAPRSDHEARGLFLAGKAAYEDGRFKDALEHFHRAYELSERPELLYNIGQTLDRLRRDKEAVHAFEQYLGRVPDSPYRNNVEARIRALEQAIEEQQAKEARAPKESKESTARPPSPRGVAERAQPAGTSTQAASAGLQPAEQPMTDEGEQGGVEWWVWAGGGAAVVVGALVTGLVIAASSGDSEPLGTVPGDDGVVHTALTAR